MEGFDLKRERRYCSRLGWALLLLLLWSFIWQAILYVADDFFPMTDTVYYTAAMVGPYLLYPLFGWIVCPRKRMPAPAWHHISKIRFLHWFVAGVCIMTLGNILGTAVDGLLYRLAGNEPVSLISETIDLMPIPAIFLGVCVVAPLCEELVFRGLIANRLSLYGEKPAAVVSALLFGLYHANFGQFFYTFGLGILLAYAYFRSGRIAVPVMLHMLFNIYGGLLPTVFSISDIAILSYAAADFLFSIAGAIILLRSFGTLIWKRGPYPPLIRVTFCNAGVILVLIAYFLETALTYILPL